MDVLSRPSDLNLLYLHRNESRFFSEALRAQAMQALYETNFVSTYPDCEELVRLLARFHSIPECCLSLTAGAEEGIVRVLRLLSRPGSEIVITTPTFPPIAQHAANCGFTLRPVPWIFGEFPIDEILASVSSKTRAIFLVSPNNPTGRSISFGNIKEISEEFSQGTVVVDNVYGAFDKSFDLKDLAGLHNCIALRSLSKSWCIPGLRVGFVVAKSEVKRQLDYLGGAFPISSLSIKFAEYCLRFGVDGYLKHLSLIENERLQLTQLLGSLGAEVVPSHANFLFARFADAAYVDERLREFGIVVKTFFDTELKEFLRIALPGHIESFQRVLDAFVCCLSNSYKSPRSDVSHIQL